MKRPKALWNLARLSAIVAATPMDSRPQPAASAHFPLFGSPIFRCRFFCFPVVISFFSVSFFSVSLLPLIQFALPVGAFAADKFGSIAYDQKTGAWGVSWDQRSEVEANEEALKECRKKSAACEIVVHVQGECGAYAAGSDGASGWGTGRTQSLAQRYALKYCSEGAKDCSIVGWTCNASDNCEQLQIERNACESRNFYRSSQGDSYRETCNATCP